MAGLRALESCEGSSCCLPTGTSFRGVVLPMAKRSSVVLRDNHISLSGTWSRVRTGASWNHGRRPSLRAEWPCTSADD